MDLAKRAVACKRWRWMVGAESAGGLRVSDIDSHGVPCAWTFTNGENFAKHQSGYGTPGWCADIWSVQVPNLADPATRGCLLALVREAWGAPLGQASPAIARDQQHSDEWIFYTNLYPSGDPRFHASTEAGCLVAALEAAP